MFLARFSANLKRKLDLTNAFKSFFRYDSVKLCSKIAAILGKQRLKLIGAGARARETTVIKTWDLPLTLKEP